MFFFDDVTVFFGDGAFLITGLFGVKLKGSSSSLLSSSQLLFLVKIFFSAGFSRSA
jgi:hypothetical protein